MKSVLSKRVTNMTPFGRAVQLYCAEHGIRQGDLAYGLGISGGFLSEIMYGRKRLNDRLEQRLPQRLQELYLENQAESVQGRLEAMRLKKEAGLKKALAN